MYYRNKTNVGSMVLSDASIFIDYKLIWGWHVHDYIIYDTNMQYVNKFWFVRICMYR